MGRMHRFTQVDTLTKDNLIDILIKSEESALIKYKNLFMAHNKTLVLDDEVFELIADNALALKTGARGLAGQLATVLEEKIIELDYSNNNEQEIIRVTKQDAEKSKCTIK
jgi:ATP-dependent Clp protease ATP-binding subunit ClpX